MTKPHSPDAPTAVSADFIALDQQYDRYDAEAHDVWRLLYERRMATLHETGSQVFLTGMERIGLEPDRVPDLRVVNPEELPDHPIAIAVSASLFGEWQVAVMDSARAPQDPEVAKALADARIGAAGKWPGAKSKTIPFSTVERSRRTNANVRKMRSTTCVDVMRARAPGDRGQA